FMDQKLKNYSSGMQVRLAFSIAIREESDILLFDEVLAVGDAAFQQKCYEMFANMKEEGRTIILVTHDMSAVQRFCEKAILIDGGKIVLSGNPSEIADRYLEQNLDVRTKKKNKAGQDEIVNNYVVKNIKVTSKGASSGTRTFTSGYPITAEFTIASETTTQPIHVGFQVFNTDGAYVFGTNSKNAHVNPITAKVAKISVTIDQTLGPGTYYINVAVMNKNVSKVFRYLPKAVTFNIKQDSDVQGIVLMKNEWKVQE
ncbi:MAG TPA: Wzt carbohydrate-binding domain-containing protein, partial [Candidatus Limnocylindria bacterium]|nr:Wzt carbohydrate-binding domain-containing protein [Candidatus Limnocylindria bacterium]